MILQNENRIVNDRADCSAMAKVLVEDMRFMHGVRGCESALRLLPAWVSEFFMTTPVFSVLACAEFEQVYAHTENEHDRLLDAHQKVNRSRRKRFVDSALERGASGAHRFTRLQATQEIIDT
eukprot:4016280-Pyramimonas_sp.AAC.1